MFFLALQKGLPVKSVLKFFWSLLLRTALWFRYKITVKGLDKLDKTSLTRPGGVLFLPNHPTIFVDPVAATLAILPKFLIRPLIVEYMYYYPVANSLMRSMNALPIPDFDVSSNTLKRKKSEQVITDVIGGLKKGDHFLIYPAGRIKSSNSEMIGGASGVHRILHEAPEANVVLMRIKGLWGSKFSRAQTGAKPLMFPTLWWGFKQVLKNLIFFTPRREIIVELEAAPADFPRNGSRIEVNQWLEKWFNKPDGLTEQIGEYPGDSLVLVPYSIWDRKMPDVSLVAEPKDVKRSVDLSKIPVTIQEKVIAKIAMITDNVPSSIKPEMSLSNDLGMDSLDIAEIAVFVHDQFDVASVPVKELTTVGRVMGIAAKQVVCKEPYNDEIGDMRKWYSALPHKPRGMPPGVTIPEVFINNAKQLGKLPACGDARSGILSYNDLLLRSIIVAKMIAKIPGKRIGVMLPASVAAEICILAIQLAGKVPVMVNWTVGPRHLESVVKLSDPKVVLSSWSFIDRLEGVDLTPIEDRLQLLEDLRRSVGTFDKLKAYLISKRSTRYILNALSKEKLKSHDEAVILFTSGTESMPKGVPLTHANILENQREALRDIELFSDDILYGILPPFHSFGFSISALLPILCGIRVAFYPDPTDGKALAQGFERWRITLMCGAPTFIKGMLKSAVPSQLKTMRLCVSGAEKAPLDLFEMLKSIGKDDVVIEGYGITECSPVLTMNRPEEPKKGVGRALGNVELLVVHPETLETMPPNQQGLILARGPNVFSGYLNPGIEPPFVTVGGKEWYRTGDLGDLDDKGYLTISGRLKRFIKIGPEMISLSAIEDALLELAKSKGWPVFQEGPSLAISAKETDGDKPKILLFTKFPVSLDEVNKAMRDAGFSNLVKISAVQQIDEIPIMGTGKVNYRLIEQRYLGKT
jgi:long-chain-fatty-acid--[acyl-carrier-protein] ligase